MLDDEKHPDFHRIESYLGVYDNIKDPKLERCIVNGKKCAKLTSSRLNGVTDIEDVSDIIYHITTSMTAVLRIHQGPHRLRERP